MSTPLSELPLSELPVPSEPPQKLFAEPTKIRVKRAEMAAHMDDHLKPEDLSEYFSTKK
jgi:hypothetical protein